jgi:hypothetical protein
VRQARERSADETEDAGDGEKLSFQRKGQVRLRERRRARVDEREEGKRQKGGLGSRDVAIKARVREGRAGEK